MPCGDLEDLPRRTASDKRLCDKAFNIAKNKKIIPKGICFNDLQVFEKSPLLRVQINLLRLQINLSLLLTQEQELILIIRTNN